MIQQRLQRALDSALRKTHYGFRRGRSCVEAIHIVKRLQDIFRGRQDARLYMLFLDWAKAFDTVQVAGIQRALYRMGVTDHYMELIKEIYSNNTFSVLGSGGYVTEPRPRDRGILQGCPLSPFLFVIIMTVICMEVDIEFTQLRPISSWPHGLRKILEIAYLMISPL